MFHFHSSPQWLFFSFPSHVLFYSLMLLISSHFMSLSLLQEEFPRSPPGFSICEENLVLCNLSPSQFSGHSFRNGAATSTAAQGVSTASLQQLRCWSTSAFFAYVCLNFHSVLCSTIYLLLVELLHKQVTVGLFSFNLSLLPLLVCQARPSPSLCPHSQVYQVSILLLVSYHLSSPFACWARPHSHPPGLVRFIMSHPHLIRHIPALAIYFIPSPASLLLLSPSLFRLSLALTQQFVMFPFP
ncbi:hypothetical protein ATANTOWER_030996 [Ataeniobius toweri]|uniref:Uncharacterized protein n=1 Tax=Ataeniobius toweri TaxID=208326 RepID=A0ABU7CMJ2_9TELE|nr:hypothetical protein [Ataeniobius toweri]